MRVDARANASRILLCCVFLFPQLSASQSPAPLGKLFITSKSPGASMSINGTPRNEKTPITLAVVPGTYKVVIGTCAEQPVTVASGETKEVTCGK
jgi:PEGA domain